MGESVWAASAASSYRAIAAPGRHTLLVRVTHWLTTICFVALVVTGIEIIISHPRFYWGETGNVNTAPLFQIPIPSSRGTVPTGYGYALPDQNGWSRYLHFEAGWLLVFTSALYLTGGLLSGHFRRDLLPEDVSFQALRTSFGEHLRFRAGTSESAYNVLQRLAYLFVIFGIAPLLVWSGLAMSPAIASAMPWLVGLLGGQQSARTIHFFATIALVIFFVVHVLMVATTGFQRRMQAMLTGRVKGASHG
jgi:thiosulfate reductase cytochrome b subunit